MIIDYFTALNNIDEIVNDFQNSIEYVFFNEGKDKKCNITNITRDMVYREYYRETSACVELLRFLNYQIKSSKHDFFAAASSLDSNLENNEIDTFKLNVRSLQLGFKRMRGNISTTCEALDIEEKERLNEAIHCYLENCYFSSIAMSVSAVESRLLKLMINVSPESKVEIEKNTLGQLIYEYSNNKAKYKNVVPEKHKALLDLCNTYRVFSVHPKKQKVTPQIATSVLSLSIEFLTDKDTRVEVAGV